MASNYEDGEIYYDNMEIMEKIEERKTSRGKPPIPSQPPPPLSVMNGPPKLPPKKKNLPSPKQMIPMKPPIKPSLAINKSANGTSEKSPPKQNLLVKPKDLQVKNLSKPATALQDVQNKPKLKSFQNNSPASPPQKINIPQSPINPKPAQVWNHPSLLRTRSIVEEPLAPIVEEDAMSEVSPRSSIADPQTNKHSEDEVFTFDSSHTIHKENLDTASAMENRNETSKHDKPKKVQIHDEPSMDDDGLVRPYGTADLQWCDGETDTTNLMSSPISIMRQSLPKDLALKRFTRSPAFERSGYLGSPSSPAPQSPAPQSPAPQSPPPQSPADFGHSSEDSGSGVCPYMSIPIQMETGSLENAPKRHLSNIKSQKQNFIRNASDKYVDDENIYDEIHDFNKDVTSCDDAMQKALDDINEVLQSMNIEGIPTIAPKPKARRFPVSEKSDKTESNNFNDKNTKPVATQKISSPKQDVPLPAPPDPLLSQTTPPKAYPRHHKPHHIISQALISSGDERSHRGRLSSEESEPRGRKMKDNRQTSQKSHLESGIKDQKDNLTVLSKSRESISRKDAESSVSRRTSRGDIEESSEADSCSMSGKQSDTTSGIVKSTGNSTSSLENLRGSTKSLGRSSSFDRKKSSSFRAKFRFRSKSQDRYRGDSDSLGPSVSDAEEKSKAPRQRGSRLRRRLSRKRMENRESADSKSVEDLKVTSDNRPSTSVSFIRKLLRKSKQSSSERPTSYGKPVVATPAVNNVNSEKSSNQSQVYPEAAKDKQMASPPSRRARKMLHPRAARDKATSDSSNSDIDNDYRRNIQMETLKKKDEYLEPCDPSDTSFDGDSTKERRRKPNTHRSKQTRERLDSSGMSSLHREKYRALVSLNAQTLKKITEKWLKEWRNKLPVGGFLITSWADIVIASKHPQCIIGRTVIYESYFATNPDHRLACQLFDRRDVSDTLIAQLEHCATLTAHPTLCSVCSHFYCKVPGSLMYPPREDVHVEALCVVLSNVPAASLATYISRWREVKEQKQKHKQILLMLLQLLQAMDNLSKSGFTPSNITVDNLIVTQDMGLLQVMPHMDALDFQTRGPRGPRTMVSQFSGVLSRTLQMAFDSGVISSPSFPVYSYLSAILRISHAIISKFNEFEIVTLQRLVQCALWGPKSPHEVSDSNEDIYDTLSAWIEVKQAELVNDIAVLFTAKSDAFPIYLFYKHEYFSRIDPRSLFQNLRVLGRI